MKRTRGLDAWPDDLASRPEDAAAALDAQPFSALLGARLAGYAPGEVVIEVEIYDRHRQQYGLVHGGVLAYLADNALAFTAGTALGPSLVTTSLSIDYLRGARDGLLRATGTLVDHTRRHAVCRVDVECAGADGQGTLCAIAHGTALPTSPPATTARVDGRA